MSDEQELAGGFTSLPGDISDSQAVPGGLHQPPPMWGKAGGPGRTPAPRGERCF